jgi:hypothetical protein
LRDKRIPRESLNGLLIERSGLSKILYQLTGIGGPWAQDPPPYAQVVAFETGQDLDWSHTRIADWRGWQHDRRIYFVHQGPIIVIDEANGPPRQRAGIMWHLAKGSLVSSNRLHLEPSEQPTEVVFLTLDPAQNELTFDVEEDGRTRTAVFLPAQLSGRLEIATVILPSAWVGAAVEFQSDARTLIITKGENSLILPLEGQ